MRFIILFVVFLAVESSVEDVSGIIEKRVRYLISKDSSKDTCVINKVNN